MSATELNLNDEKRRFYAARSEEVIKNLIRRNMSGQFCATKSEALNAVMELIPPGATVGRGDSMSLEQVGILKELRRRGANRVIDPFNWDAEGNRVFEAEDAPKTPKDDRRIFTEAMLADVFLSGTNAITLDGKLVNVDAYGNRVAGLIWAEKVIVVVGGNKIVADEKEAIERTRSYAAPLNNYRHLIAHKMSKYQTQPCVVAGKCMDCRQSSCICRYTVIIRGDTGHRTGHIHVVIVGEDLGI